MFTKIFSSKLKSNRIQIILYVGVEFPQGRLFDTCLTSHYFVDKTQTYWIFKHNPSLTQSSSANLSRTSWDELNLINGNEPAKNF